MNKTTKTFALSSLLILGSECVYSQQIGDPLPKWKAGYLDLHHINTGRGDAAFYILPDGTTMLVDAGDMSEIHPRTVSPRNAEIKPDPSKTAGQWIADYIKQFSPAKSKAELDYALITHFHNDHMGEIDDTSRLSKYGEYHISGITEVAEEIRVRTLIDRDYPDYNYPNDLKSPVFQAKMMNSSDPEDRTYMSSMIEYWNFQKVQKKTRGMDVEQLEAGSNQQIVLTKDRKDYPDFEVRNIHSNGQAWTGWGKETFNLVSEGKGVGENNLSLGIRISYGAFDYYTGGDIAGNNNYGEADFSREETKVAPVIGPVDIATLNHHGNRDAQSSYYVRTIRPKVWIQQSWSADHPGEEVFKRLTSTELYPGQRYLFATAMLDANRHVMGSSIDRAYQATSGHIVVRVNKGGDSYRIFVLNDDKSRKIVKMFGPIKSR